MHSLDVHLFLFGTSLCAISSSNCCFLTCIQVSQEAGQVDWYSHLLKNFPQIIVIHTVKGFGIVNKAEIYVFSRTLFPFPEDLPNPEIEPRSTTLQGNSLPAEPQGKPKNTGMGSLCLLQGIFLIQDLNRGLLHCRQILYQLSYHGSHKVESTYKTYF